MIKRRQRLQQRKLTAIEVVSLLRKLVAGRERGTPRPMGFVQTAPVMSTALQLIDRQLVVK